MTKKQQRRLSRNRDSQRLAVHEHFNAGQFENEPSPPMRRTARGLRESERDAPPPRDINRHVANIHVNPRGQMRAWLTQSII